MELNYKFNLQRSPIDARDFMLESIYPIQVDLPLEWDLRPNMQPIRDQGREGSCSAQTAAAMKEWQEKVDVGFNQYMSPQFIYNLRSDLSTEGMTPRDTMQILNKIGIVPEKVFPYGTMTRPSDAIISGASDYEIMGYSQINTLDSLKKALYANGPCYIAFPVYNPENMEFWKPDFQGQQMVGGHAVCLSGYLKDKFIIRNHWSAAWGDKGYTYYPFTEWGMHWECWTTIDAESNHDGLVKKLAVTNSCCTKTQGFFARIFGKKLNK